MRVTEVLVVLRRPLDAVPTMRQFVGPPCGSLSLDLDRRTLRGGPGVEASDRTCQRPPSGVHGLVGSLTVKEESGRELQQDLGLGVATHGPENCRQGRRHG